MQPYYEHGGITILLGDCREILPTLPKCDLVLTDPPYGLDFKGESWDAEVPSWWLPIARGLAPSVVFTTAPTTLWDYPRPDWVACWHRQAAQSRTSYGGFNHWTPILVYGKCSFLVDVLALHAMANARKKGFGHPSPKPDRLMKWLIEGCCPETGSIIDPFMGSGTTLRAAKDLHRKAIGIEIEERYCEIAANRLRQNVLTLG
jgi:site-specific DNA-methyltransferase (adenine-specific)